MKSSFPNTPKRVLCAALILVAASLSACGDKAKEKKPGQALASVNGEEVTVLQLNEELQRANVNATQKDAASKQLLQVLIDRQLLDDAAAKENLDRDPKVMQAIDRARSLILAQAYLQKRMGSAGGRPAPAEVEDYFNKHPEFFSNRKQFTMNEIVIPAEQLTPEVRAAADGAKSLEEVAVWLDAHKIKFGRSEVTRSTADVPAQLSAKLLGMPKGQLFVIKEGPRAMFIAVNEVRDAPVTLAVAGPQIEGFLANQKSKELAGAEIARLRTGAKIEYLNKSMMPDAKSGATPAGTEANSAVAETSPAGVGVDAGGAAAPGAAPASAQGSANGASTDKGAVARGVAGLK
jgi:peptidyl-prolyl cis-trans isomerase C